MAKENEISDVLKDEQKKTSEMLDRNTIASASVGIVGVAYCACEIHEEAKSQEWKLLKTTNEQGKSTGHGNMFENIIVRDNPGSSKVNNPGTSSNPLYREKNGPDIKLADGTDVQGKCCFNAERTADSLIKDGNYRYPGQKICVPKGQGDEVRQRLLQNGIDAPVMEASKTYLETRELCKPGFRSMFYEMTNPAVMKWALVGGTIAGLCSYIYLSKHLEGTTWKKALYAAGVGVATTVALDACYVGHSQFARMQRL